MIVNEQYVCDDHIALVMMDNRLLSGIMALKCRIAHLTKQLAQPNPLNEKLYLLFA